MIVARHMGELGALPARTAGGARTLNLRKKPAAAPPPPPPRLNPAGALRRPSPVSAVARPAVQRAITPTPAPAPALNKRKSPTKPAPSPPIDSYEETYAPPASGGGGGGSVSWPDLDVASAGATLPADVPIKDAYVSVSGGIPDGAFYAIMAATAAAVGFVLWRRSRRK